MSDGHWLSKMKLLIWMCCYGLLLDGGNQTGCWKSWLHCDSIGEYDAYWWWLMEIKTYLWLVGCGVWLLDGKKLFCDWLPTILAWLWLAAYNSCWIMIVLSNILAWMWLAAYKILAWMWLVAYTSWLTVIGCLQFLLVCDWLPKSRALMWLAAYNACLTVIGCYTWIGGGWPRWSGDWCPLHWAGHGGP